MKNNEIEQLKELLFQKEQLLLESRAGLAEAIVDRFGEEAEEVIKSFLREGARTWAANAADADIQANNKNDIQGLMNFLWEPLRREGFEFTYDRSEQGYQMKVTRCPVAEIAQALNIEKWGYIFHCMGDDAVCEGYNPDIAVRRTKMLMTGDEYCDHFYFYREHARNT